MSNPESPSEPRPPASVAGWHPDSTGRDRWWNGTEWEQYAPERQTNNAAWASIVLAVIGIFFLFTIYLTVYAFPIIPLALAVGIVALRRAQTRGGVGRVKAVVGIVLSALPILLFAVTAVTGNIGG